MIPIYALNGVLYVWNSDDWLTIRQAHRIVGNLIGVTAKFPRQDVYNGLPMTLMYEEACLLVDEGICELYDCEELKEPPDLKSIEDMKEAEEFIYNEQAQILKKKRIEKITAKMDIIAAGKQKHGSTADPEQLLKQEIDKLVPLQRQYGLVQIPTEYPWPLKKTKVALDAVILKSDKEFARKKAQIFKDLWKRGYHLTSGEKFGGDFLVYPGDPVKFHAMYIVECLASNDVELKPRKLVAFGRLGVAVNKITVYATVNADGAVDYQSLQWHETI